jgi:transcription initiation factor TFIID subunit 5
MYYIFFFFCYFSANALDLYKHELHAMLYPVFLHMYLELVYNAHYAKAENFMKKFGPIQEYYYQQDIAKLASVTKREHMRNNDFLDALRSSQFTVRLSRDSYSVLRRFMDEKRSKVGVLLNVVQEHLYLDVYEVRFDLHPKFFSMRGKQNQLGF